MVWEELEELQDLAAAGLLVEQVVKEVQEEQEVKVSLVELLANAMLSREPGLHTRTHMIRSTTAVGTVESTVWTLRHASCCGPMFRLYSWILW